MSIKSERSQHTSKAKFTPEEDEMIRVAISSRGLGDWSGVAIAIPNRTARQIRERYKNYLAPDVNQTPWTASENDLLGRLVGELGPSWSRLVTFFENRTDVAIKNHYNLLRRQAQKAWRKLGVRKITAPSAPAPHLELDIQNMDICEDGSFNNGFDRQFMDSQSCDYDGNYFELVGNTMTADFNGPPIWIWQ
jgi:hypothetical protein